MSFLKGKKILVVGLLSNKSIAYGVAKALARQGAELAFTYQDERFRQRVASLSIEFTPRSVIKCDVGSDEDIENTFRELENIWD